MIKYNGGQNGEEKQSYGNVEKPCLEHMVYGNAGGNLYSSGCDHT